MNDVQLNILLSFMADIKGRKEAVTQMIDSLKTLSDQTSDVNFLDLY